LIQAEAEAPARITQQLRERLSPTKVPKQVFVLDEFPRTEAGKVSKHKLRTLVS
jgi:long-chain acyl-CoA synthetase